MYKCVYSVHVVHDLELLRYVLRCAIERQLYFPLGLIKYIVIVVIVIVNICTGEWPQRQYILTQPTFLSQHTLWNETWQGASNWKFPMWHVVLSSLTGAQLYTTKVLLVSWTRSYYLVTVHCNCGCYWLFALLEECATVIEKNVSTFPSLSTDWPECSLKYYFISCSQEQKLCICLRNNIWWQTILEMPHRCGS